MTALQDKLVSTGKASTPDEAASLEKAASKDMAALQDEAATLDQAASQNITKYLFKIVQGSEG